MRLEWSKFMSKLLYNTEYYLRLYSSEQMHVLTILQLLKHRMHAQVADFLACLYTVRCFRDLLEIYDKTTAHEELQLEHYSYNFINPAINYEKVPSYMQN